MSTFRAIVVSEFGGPSVMKLEERTIEKLEPGQVLVDVKAVGVNPVDTYIRSGNYTRVPQLPYTPGANAAGVIEKVEGDCGPWKAGDRVYLAGSLTGAYAEKLVCTPNQLHRLPDRISYLQGAAVYIAYTTAYCSLFSRAQAKPGESVLIHGGSGGVGLAAIQLAKARGLRVLATASAPEGLKAIESFGAEPFCHKEPNYTDEILKATNGEGVNIIIEMLSNVNLATDVSSLCAKYGRVVIVGCRGSIEINPRALMTKNLLVMGMALQNATSDDMKEAFSAIEEGLSNSTLNPVVDSAARWTLAEAAGAHDHVMNRPSGTIGKVVLHVE